MFTLIIYATLLSLTLVRGNPSSSDQLRECTTTKCPNEHVIVTDSLDGAIHRYSKNAANFQDTRAPPDPSISRDAPNGANQFPPVRAGANQFSQPAQADSNRQPLDSVRSVSENRTSSGVGVQQQHKQDVYRGPPQDTGSVLGAAGHQHVQSPHGLNDGHQGQEKIHQQQHLLKQQSVQQNFQPVPDGNRKQGHRSNGSDVHQQQEELPAKSDWGHIVEDGMFWSADVEGAIPPGLNDADAEAWSRKIRTLKVTRVENATRSLCGSDQNRHIVLEDGSTTCARYRHPRNHLVFGDLYCYHLSRMLGLQNVPTVVLSKVTNDSSSQWSSVSEDVINAGWRMDNLASFSYWISDLGKAELPKILFENLNSTLYPWTPGLDALNRTDLVELAQYSDLIIFDYITAHLDRMTIRKSAVDYYKQDSLYAGEVHNLARHKNNGGLWFIDNENGIFNAYPVIYQKHYTDLYGYHEELLRSMCIFRRSTVTAVEKLAAMEDPFEVLIEKVYDAEPTASTLEELRIWQDQDPLHERFKSRIGSVAKWMKACKNARS